MKFSTVVLPIALAATTMVQPGQADIGRGISLVSQLFTEGIASLGAEIADRSKRATGGFVTKARQARPPTVPEQTWAWVIRVLPPALSDNIRIQEKFSR
jgi:hypothetical protein